MVCGSIMASNNSKWQIWTKTVGESHVNAKLVGLNLEQLDAVNLTAKLNDMITIRRMVEWKTAEKKVEQEKSQTRPNRRTRRRQAAGQNDHVQPNPITTDDTVSEVYPAKKLLKMPDIEFYYREESFPIFEIWYAGKGKNKKIRTLFDQDIANRTCTTLQKFYARYHKDYIIYMLLIPYKPSTDIIFPGYLTLTDKDISDEKCQQSMLQMFQITDSSEEHNSDTDSDEYGMSGENMLFDALQMAEFDEVREALITEMFNFEEFLMQNTSLESNNPIPNIPVVDFLILDFNPGDPIGWNIDEDSTKKDPEDQEESEEQEEPEETGDIWAFMDKLPMDIFDYMAKNGWFSS